MLGRDCDSRRSRLHEPRFVLPSGGAVRSQAQESRLQGVQELTCVSCVDVRTDFSVWPTQPCLLSVHPSPHIHRRAPTTFLNARADRLSRLFSLAFDFSLACSLLLDTRVSHVHSCLRSSRCMSTLAFDFLHSCARRDEVGVRVQGETCVYACPLTLVYVCVSVQLLFNFDGVEGPARGVSVLYDRSGACMQQLCQDRRGL